MTLCTRSKTAVLLALNAYSLYCIAQMVHQTGIDVDDDGAAAGAGSDAVADAEAH